MGLLGCKGITFWGQHYYKENNMAMLFYELEKVGDKFLTIN